MIIYCLYITGNISDAESDAFKIALISSKTVPFTGENISIEEDIIDSLWLHLLSAVEVVK